MKIYVCPVCKIGQKIKPIFACDYCGTELIEVEVIV